jgi:hypothetical protein
MDWGGGVRGGEGVGGDVGVSGSKGEGVREGDGGMGGGRGESGGNDVVAALLFLGCNPPVALQSLKQYVLLRRASLRHFGESQGTRVWVPLLKHLIAPVLF